MNKKTTTITFWLEAMRITGTQILLAIVLSGVVLAKGKAQEALRNKVTVSFNGTPLNKAIELVGERAGIDITYNSSVLPKDSKVNAAFSDQTIDRVLTDLLDPFGITYVVVENQVVLRKKPEVLPALNSIRIPEIQLPDDIRVTGTVTDENNEPLPGVSILIKGSQRGTTTGSDGRFAIDIPNSAAVLIFSFVGYLTQEIQPVNRANMTVILEVDQKTLEEVVVVGYGTVNRKDLTGSVASVSGKDLKDIPVTSAAQAIAGRLPGVQVTKTEGSPDADIKIRVRGGGSITQDNSPLFLVDGFPVNDINDISPTDILTIDVLKDASSTAIYGARGANGVVIITTKGGQEGKGKVSYNMYYGQKQVTRYIDVLDPYEYVYWQYELINNDATFSGRFGDLKDIDLYKEMKGTQWQHLIFGQIGSSLSHNLSFSGGNKVTRYNISLTRNDEKEVMIGSGFGRTNLTIRTTNQINRWLSFDLNTRFSDMRLKGAGTSSNSRLSHAVQFRPTEGFSEFADKEIADEDYEIETAVTLNPLKQTIDDYRRQNQMSINFNGAFNIHLPLNLSYRLEFGKQYSFLTNNRFYGIHTSNAINAGTQPLANINKRNGESYRIANILSYSKKEFLPGNNLNIMVGQELNHDKSESITTSVRYLPKYIDAVSALNMMQLGLSDPITTTDYAPSKLSSFFGRINYDYKGKYLFSSTLRVDGSSKFAPGNQWGYFPSAAGAWRISDEHFLSTAKSFLDDLKIRASLGAAGNNRIADNAWRKTLSVQSGPLFLEGSESTPTPFLRPDGILSNPLLKWETTITRNLGLDFALFKRRVSGSFEIYKNTTRDLLISATVPSSTGYNNQFQNIGQTSNRGIELSLNTVWVETRDFSFSTSLNIAFNRNRIDKLGEAKSWEQTSGWAGSDGPTGDYLIEEGGKVGLMYGFETHPDKMYGFDDFSYENGVYTLKEGVPNNAPLILAKWFRPGSLKFVDQNKDGTVDAGNDKIVIGDANPKHTGGINFISQYKGFDLSVFFNWVYGNDIYNANKLDFTTRKGGRLYKNILAEMNSQNRFTYINKETGLLVNDPVQLAEMNKDAKFWATSMSLAPLHSWVIEDGSFLRLNTMTLGYSLPKSLLSRLHIQQLRLYASGFNLKTWTRYTGYDPEVDTIRSTALTPGIDFNAYPRSRSYNVGLNLTF